MNNIDYEKLEMELVISGAKTEEEYDWARRVGMDAYNRWARWANDRTYSNYNSIWASLYPDCRDMTWNHPNYNKIWYGIAQLFIKACLLSDGRYRQRKNLKLKINPNYELKPTEEENIYIVDDMISIIRKRR